MSNSVSQNSVLKMCILETLWHMFHEIKLCTKFYVPGRKYLYIIEWVVYHFMPYLAGENFIHLDKLRFGVGVVRNCLV